VAQTSPFCVRRGFFLTGNQGLSASVETLAKKPSLGDSRCFQTAWGKFWQGGAEGGGESPRDARNKKKRKKNKRQAGLLQPAFQGGPGAQKGGTRAAGGTCRRAGGRGGRMVIFNVGGNNGRSPGDVNISQFFFKPRPGNL